MTQQRSVTCHMGSHSVTFHLTQVNTPCLNPSHYLDVKSWYSYGRSDVAVISSEIFGFIVVCVRLLQHKKLPPDGDSSSDRQAVFNDDGQFTFFGHSA